VLQTSLLKRNRRMKQRDSLPLNAATELGVGSPTGWYRSKCRVGSGGRSSPEVLEW